MAVPFLTSLHFSIENSNYWNIVLKPKQVRCLEAIYNGKDVVGVLPTGYGKSIIFHLLPLMFLHKCNIGPCSSSSPSHDPLVIVVSPLNALINDQIKRLGNIRATVLNVMRKTQTEVELDTSAANRQLLKEAKYNILFAHPEAFVSCKGGIELLQSQPYQKSVSAIVIDEAHCILEWGDDFRKDYSSLAMLCATFPSVPIVALTATASKSDVTVIKESLNLRSPLEVVGNPNRSNVFYEKIFCKADDLDFFEELLIPIATELKEKKLSYPLTIMYLPLRWCGFAFKYFQRHLGSEQYFPATNENMPEHRLFAQYHAPQTSAMKDQILKELATLTSTVRVVFATVALGMGVDIPAIRKVIHVGPPHTVRAYLQETGRAGRDGKQSTALLYYSNKHIASNREGIGDDIRSFCGTEHSCLRKMLLNCLGAGDFQIKIVHHLCCSYCKGPDTRCNIARNIARNG